MSEYQQTQNLILIIDDDPMAIRLLSNILKEQGTIIFATSGEAGLQLARERRPQLILLDAEMPVMDGYEVCRKLKSDPDAGSASIIFVTANTSMESEIAALDGGAADFIIKPLNAAVALARVRTQLRIQQQAAEMAHLANRDGLTGLFNRRYLDQVLEKEGARHKRQRLPLGLAMIDIDYFKLYNDGYGHQAGDTVA